MEILVSRIRLTDISTTGIMFVDGHMTGYTLEDVTRPPGEKVHGKTAIPKGTYKVIINFSKRFQRDMPLLLNVPGFEGVRIHAGNTAEDTEGCILVGRVRKENMILESRVLFEELLQKIRSALDKGEEVTITVD